MKKMTLTFFLAATLCSFTFAQHIMDVIEGDFPSPIESLTHDNRLYVPYGSALKVYAGEAYEDFSMPVVGGRRLTFSGDIFSYRGDPFVTMYNGVDAWFLGRFNGSSFTTIRFPFPLVSNAVVFNDRVNVVLQTPAGPKLYSYNGSSLTEAGSLPAATRFKLHFTPLFLYVDCNSRGTRALCRYNGTTISTIPIPLSARDLTKALQIRSTTGVYLIMHDVVYHYNGVTLSEIYRHPYELGITSATMWNGTLYFQYYTGTEGYEELLYRCTGTSLSIVTLPPGTSIPLGYGEDELAIYRGHLYFPLVVGTETFIYRYDGARWESVYNWGEHSRSLTIRERQGKLLFYRILNGRTAVEYDGEATFETFSVPTGILWFVEPRGTTACYHLWMTSYVEDYDYKWSFVKETFDSLCVIPSPGSASVIPANLGEFDRFDIGNRARERDWCWTGIDIDWDITPICLTPPCAPPRVQTTLVDKTGKVAWQKIFDKPFTSSFSLADDQPYTLSVAIEKDKKFNSILLMDKELVNKGVEDLSLDFHPKEDYFRLTVATNKQNQVPMMMTLRNTAGAALWQKKFTAPFDDVVSAYVAKAGNYLQFSLQSQPQSISYYPNPFNGKLNFTIEEGSDPMAVSLSDMNGKVIAQKQLKESGEHSIDITGQKPGLYILTITDGNTSRRELIQLK